MTHRIIQDKTANIHYFLYKNESKELVVFLHSAYADHTLFDSQLAAFTPHFNVITFDLVGHGLSNVFTRRDRIDSTPEQIKRILALEGFESAHFVGVSLGSLLAQYCAFVYPELVRSVTALGGYNIHDNNDEINKAQKETVKKLMWTSLTSMDKFRRHVAEHSVREPENVERYFGMSKRFIRKSFLAMSGIKKVVCECQDVSHPYPLLILVGEYDTALAKRAVRKWHSDVPASLFEIIPSAGHCANMDNPEAFNRIVLDFISTI